MPRISKQEINVGDNKYHLQLHYNQKDGFFYKGLSSTIIETVRSADGADVYAPFYMTESALLEDTKKLLWRYFELITKERKIILITAGFGSAIRMNKVSIHEFRGINHKAGKTSNFGSIREFDHSVGFNYKTGVVVEGSTRTFFETMNDENGNEIERDKHGRQLINLPSNKTVELDWTPEREKFLRDIANSMEVMAVKMAAFFSDKEKMLLMIDTKQKLLV